MRIDKEIVLGGVSTMAVTITDTELPNPFAYRVTMIRGTYEIFSVHDYNEQAIEEKDLPTVELLLTNVHNEPRYDPNLHTTLFIYTTQLGK